MTSRLSFSDHEVSEICRLIRSAFCPKDEQLASVLSGVRAVFPACLEVQRSACLVLLALVGEVALDNSASAVPLWKCAGMTAPGFMSMCNIPGPSVEFALRTASVMSPSLWKGKRSLLS
jgi:hypothetical protein